MLPRALSWLLALLWITQHAQAFNQTRRAGVCELD
jgi:hypothetical protein